MCIRNRQKINILFNLLIFYWHSVDVVWFTGEPGWSAAGSIVYYVDQITDGSLRQVFSDHFCSFNDIYVTSLYANFWLFYLRLYHRGAWLKRRRQHSLLRGSDNWWFPSPSLLWVLHFIWTIFIVFSRITHNTWFGGGPGGAPKTPKKDCWVTQSTPEAPL